MTDPTDEVPAFELPDWGTEGAPPPPPLLPDEEPQPDAVEVDGPLLTTMPLPDGWRVGRLLGLLAAEGRGKAVDDLAEASSAAVAAALDRLTERARASGADAVTGVRISTVSRKRTVVAIAYGTAVTIDR